ncbi:hypothetical protein C3F00_046165, partial [Pseudomonas sp. MWU13-2860]
ADKLEATLPRGSTDQTHSGKQAAQVWYQAGTNCSISRGACRFQAGDTVTASVWYKSDSQTMAQLFLGDSSGLHSYSSQQMATAYGDNGWRKLTVSMTLSEAADLSVYLYGDRDGAHHAAGHAVLFDDVTVGSAQQGVVVQDGFESGL